MYVKHAEVCIFINLHIYIKKYYYKTEEAIHFIENRCVSSILNNSWYRFGDTWSNDMRVYVILTYHLMGNITFDIGASMTYITFLYV